MAIADRDPHVIKLANVGLIEEERTADPLYRFAAAHVVGLVPSAREVVDQQRPEQSNCCEPVNNVRTYAAH